MAQDPTKRIAPGAYEALVDALSLVFWNKENLERFLKLALNEHVELLTGLSFTGPKRQAAADLVMRLANNEARYQSVTIALMLEVAAMDTFPNLERQSDKADLVEHARAAVATLRTWTDRYGDLVVAQERLRAEQERAEAGVEALRSVQAVLDELKQWFLSMYSETDPQARGRTFEGLLRDLFALFDLSPRKAFKIEHEQIDGAFTFNTDDYILEAKWEKGKASREQVDVLAQKVLRKGRNTLGLFIAVEGFSDPSLRAHTSSGSGLIFMDGADLMSVLEGQIALTDLLEAKRRHLSETGEPLLNASVLFTSG